MKNTDVTALGEILIDFTEAGVSPSGEALYERNPGGAPANVAVAVARLGGRSAFIGKVGSDPFGSFLRSTLERLGVDVSGMRVSPDAHTTLAFVSLAPGGEHSFSFCRNPGADTELRADELDLAALASTKILHVGSLSLTHESSRGATLEAIRSVRDAGGLISYDPNWRPSLWGDKIEALDRMRGLVPLADIVKVSEEELELLYGIRAETKADLDRGAKMILDAGPRLALITLGEQGTYWCCDGEGDLVPAFISDAIDTTGAGDAFVGALLYRLTRPEAIGNPFGRGYAAMDADVRFANATASVCVTRRGAIPAMPNLGEAMRVYGSA